MTSFLPRFWAGVVTALPLVACAPAHTAVSGETVAPACANLILHLRAPWPETAAALSTVAGTPLVYQRPVSTGGVVVRACPVVGDSLTALVARLQQQPQVINAEPDRRRYPQAPTGRGQ